MDEGAHVIHTYELAQPHKEVPAQLGVHQGPDFKFCERDDLLLHSRAHDRAGPAL